MRQWMAGIAVVCLAGVGAANAEPSTHSIYRCETPQGLVFSDRPCSSDSQLYEPDLSGVSVVATEVPKMTSSAAAIKPHRRVSSDRPVAAKADQCQRLHDSLRKIASTMRSGYGAKEGERLKERKRDLEAKRRAQKC